MSDLRTLCHAYLDAREVDATSVDLAASREVTRAGLALGAALGTPSTVPPAAYAAAILAALDAAEAQGHARALAQLPAAHPLPHVQRPAPDCEGVDDRDDC